MVFESGMQTAAQDRLTLEMDLAEPIQFMNTRGQHEVLFASDHPVLPFDRCLAEAAALPFREGVLEKYPRENALAVFRWDSA